MAANHPAPKSLGRPTRLLLPAAVATVYLIVSTLTRLALAIGAAGDLAAGPFALARAFAVGAVLDLRSAAWLVAPFALYLALVPERWFVRRGHRIWIALGMFGVVAAIYFVAIAEGFFFAEFDGRFNFVAVDYLMYPTEVTTNLRESYPLGAVLAGVVLLAAGTVAPLWRRLSPARLGRASYVERIGGAIALPALAVGMTLGLPAGLDRVSEDRVVNELAGNGWGSFVAALWGSHADYEGLYPTEPRATVARRLGRLLAEPASDPSPGDPLTITRHIRARGPERRWNVVVVLEESFGSEFVGALHPRASSLTPRYDALAREGVLWTHAYSTGNRTIRAIEATTASLPPLPGVSIVRRPQSANLFTLPAVLRERGYETLFVYGGRALFDGMGHYLRLNGVERVVEQSDYPDDAFTTAWGVADDAIFDRALAEMDQMEASGTPFYSLLLSVSNHRPYLFPTEHIQPDPGLKRRENAVRYADDALGRFIDRARERPFFDHTLFVLMGDHGARVYGAAEIPLASYEVPILFLAPGLLPPGRIDTLASSLDVPPSILGRLGLAYDSQFFGHDLFTLPPEQGRAVVTHNNEIALLRDGRIAVLGLRGAQRVYDIEGESFLPVDRSDRRARSLLRDAIALFYGADLEYRREVGELDFADDVAEEAPAELARSHS